MHRKATESRAGMGNISENACYCLFKFVPGFCGFMRMHECYVTRQQFFVKKRGEGDLSQPIFFFLFPNRFNAVCIVS